MNTHEFNQWMQSRGFVERPDGSWGKPRRVSNPREAQSPEPERAVLHAPVEPVQRETLYSGRVLVCVESRRTRLIDPDNLVAKWFVDCLRYSGVIGDDRAADIEIRVHQTKVPSKEAEETIITVTPI